MYRQKSVIFTIGKTLYIKAGQKLKRKRSYIATYKAYGAKQRKRVYIILIYRENTYSIRRLYKKKHLYSPYKRPLPNLNYCYIKRAAGISHLDLPNFLIYIPILYMALYI